jgi:hypothetical protein
MARQTGKPAHLGADDVIRFLDTDHFLRELAGNLGRGRAFVRTRRTFQLQDALSVEIEAPGVGWRVRAEAVVVFSRDGFVGLEFENFEQAVLPELDRMGQDAERMKRQVPSEATVIAPMPTFESSDLPHRTGVATVHITDDEPEPSSRVHMRPMPSIPEPAETEAEELLRVPVDRSSTLLEDAPLESADLPDGTQDLNMYERPRTRRPRNSEPQPRAVDIDDADATHDGTPLGSFIPPPPANGDSISSDLELEAPSSRMREETDPRPQEVPPSIEAAGLEVFEDKSHRFLRSTPGGVLRLEDEGDLLGVYLSQLRHGFLIAVGGPDGAVGATVRIKVLAGRAVTLDAKVLARVDKIVTLGIADSRPFRELLAEKKDDLLTVIESIAGPIGPSASQLAPPPPEAVPSPPPASEPEAQTSDLELVVPPLPEPEIEAPPPAPSEVQQAPAAPKLMGQVVRFNSLADLAHELKVNLGNGGLFVESSPLPLRSKKQLALAVGEADLGCTIDGEVVFADAGRVGFMVLNAHDAVPKLQQIVDSGELPSPEEDLGSIDLDPQSLAQGSKNGAQEPAGPIKGKLDAPLTMGRVLDLQFRRIDNETELAETTMLQLFEFLSRKEMRGVLDVDSDEKKKLTVWLHEGSVAFVMLKPMDETHALGRILINMKRLNDAALRQGLETGQKTRKSLGRTLVSLGLIKKTDLSAGLREQTRSVLHAAFGFKAGRFEWGPWREPPGEADLVLTKGLNVLAHHLRHRYEALGSSELEVLFGKNMGRRVVPVDDLDRMAGPLALQQKELRFLQLQVDGTRSISDAVLGSPIGRLASLRLVGVLLSLGQLRFTDGHAQVRENTSMAREPSAFVRIKKELRERLTLLRGMNHFEVLGVHWSAHHRNHKTAYDNIKKEFDLKRAPIRDAPDEVKSIAKEINTIIDTAWSTLSNADARQSYRKQLFDKTERQYAADMLVKQGELALIRGDRVTAIEALETAVELDPSNRNKALLTSAREGRR